jgi:hypothetical protein
MVIQIKDKDVFHGLLQYRFQPMLCRILRWLCNQVPEIMITESFRKKRHPNDLHGEIPVRAVDLRSSIYVRPDMLAEKINKHWQYDPDRPNMKVAVLHDSGEGMHFHIQVHPKTMRIRER